jgi:N-acetyl-alpha-D-glucosaminyl L-malate synthase BshA
MPRPTLPDRLVQVSHAPRGGSGVVARQLAEAWAGAGRAVHMLTTGAPDPADPPWMERVHGRMYPVFEQPPTTLAMASRMASLIALPGSTLLHTHYAVPWAVSAMLALLGHESPRAPGWVASLHGTDVVQTGVWPDYRMPTRLALRRAHAITAPSEDFARRVRASGLVDDDQPVHTMHNHVDTTVWCPCDPAERGAMRRMLAPRHADRPWVVHVSNLRPIKGTERLLPIMQRLRARVPDATLVLLGQGPEEAALHAQWESAGLGDHLLQPPMEADTIPRWLPLCDAMVMPSEYESFGLAALEAMACAVPPVVSAVGGLVELVDDPDLMAPPDDPVQGSADRLAALLTDGERACAKAGAVRDRACRQFDLRVLLPRWEALYARVLEATLARSGA